MQVQVQTKSGDGEMTFDELVLDWLKTDGEKPRAVALVAVQGYGNDWAGDTAGGFHREFDVSITYVDDAGKKHYMEVTGEYLGSLWNRVVKSWPS